MFGNHRPGGRWWPWAAVAVGVASLALGTTNLWQQHHESTEPAAAPAPRAADASLAGAPATAPGDAAAVLASSSAEPGAPQTLAQLLRDPGFPIDRENAVGALLELWGAVYDPAAGAACHQAELQGLRCLSLDRGSLSELRRVNWPAVLPLVDEHGAQHDVVVTALGYDFATLRANGKTFKLPLAELAYSWYGDQLLLWRPTIAQPLTPGMRDAGVLWLRETLARIRGEEPPPNGSPLYDRALENDVRRYQRERMLTVDGIVGARTQVALMAELNVPGTPSLLGEH